MKYFTSDWHLGHKLMLRLGHRPFKTMDEMNNTIIDNMFKVLKKGDILYFLGDLGWDNSIIDYFFNNKPKGVQFHWILGNHDKNSAKYSKFCESISPIKEVKVEGNTIVLCHYPLTTWNKSHFNSFMLYGHHHIGSHGTDKLDVHTEGKMLNVNVEFNDYKPWSEKDILAYMKEQPDNWDFISEAQREQERKDR
jgi:calcineurin-like phosphoesterase family protein